MKIGGTLAFWVKVAIGLVAVYLLWELYKGARAVTNAVSDAARKVGEVASDTLLPPSDVDPKIVGARYDETTGLIYDPSLDPRSFWAQIWENIPPAAYRPLTPSEQAALAKFQASQP